MLEEHGGVVLIRSQGRPLSVTMRVPGDKSISHRAVLLGSLAAEPVRIVNLLESADVLASVAAVRLLGVPVRRSGADWLIHGRGIDGYTEPVRPIDCRNSGTTARLLAGLLAASPFFSVLTGDASLRRRPMGRVTRPLTQAGAEILGRDGGRLLPLAIRGRKLEGFEYRIPEASAQVKTALVLAAMKAHGSSRILQTTPTRDHTERLLAHLGVPFRVSGEAIELTGPLQPRGGELIVPGDPSSAAFFAVAGLLVPESRVTIEGVCLNPTRLGFARVLERMGARLTLRPTGQAAGEEMGEISAEGSPLTATEIAAGEIPSLVDEVPILAVAATQARGQTRFRGVQELRTKESNRLEAVCRELSAMGAELREEGDDLVVCGPTRLKGAPVASHDDHRMAMSLAVAALVATGETEIAHAACVKISFPGFFDLFARLGGVESRESKV